MLVTKEITNLLFSKSFWQRLEPNLHIENINPANLETNLKNNEEQKNALVKKLKSLNLLPDFVYIYDENWLAESMKKNSTLSDDSRLMPDFEGRLMFIAKNIKENYSKDQISREMIDFVNSTL
jgi:ABC-type antimicrobial peptide transport system ATPase subunit